MIPIVLYAIIRVRERKGTSIPQFYVPPRDGEQDDWHSRLYFRSLYRSRKQVLAEFKRLKAASLDSMKMSIWTFRLGKVAVTDDPVNDWPDASSTS